MGHNIHLSRHTQVRNARASQPKTLQDAVQSRTTVAHSVVSRQPEFASIAIRGGEFQHYSRPNAVSSRTLPGVQLQMDRLQEYGCWCYFDELHDLGKGPTQNGYDEACKALHQGITCAAMDFPECDANTQVYDAKIRPDPETAGNVVVDCEVFNGGDECAISTCYLESHFITLLLAENQEKENTPQYNCVLFQLTQLI